MPWLRCAAVLGLEAPVFLCLPGANHVIFVHPMSAQTQEESVAFELQDCGPLFRAAYSGL